MRENDPVVWVEEIRQTRQDKQVRVLVPKFCSPFGCVTIAQVMLSVTEVIAATAIELD